MAQARAAIEETTAKCSLVPVIHTAIQQHISETTYHTLEEGGVVEYCPTTEATPTVVTTMESYPVEMLTAVSSTPPPSQAKSQELKSRIALNSARLLQEQRVTNVHVRQIAQHLEGQNELLQMIREAQAYA
ncbi:unnamed protein product [Coregonus sp. 'balchen']|nr:unnamed protein product [Coregonus sp. 'balchen']